MSFHNRPAQSALHDLPTYEDATSSDPIHVPATSASLSDKALLLRHFLRHIFCMDYDVDAENNTCQHQDVFKALANALKDLEIFEIATPVQMLPERNHPEYAAERYLREMAAERLALSKIQVEEIQMPCEELCLPVRPIRQMLSWFILFTDEFGYYTGCLPGLAASPNLNSQLGRKFVLDESLLIPAVIPLWEPELRKSLLLAVTREKEKWSRVKSWLALVSPSVDEVGVEEGKRQELEHLRREHNERKKCERQDMDGGYAERSSKSRTQTLIATTRKREKNLERWSRVSPALE